MMRRQFQPKKPSGSKSEDKKEEKKRMDPETRLGIHISKLPRLITSVDAFLSEQIFVHILLVGGSSDKYGFVINIPKNIPAGDADLILRFRAVQNVEFTSFAHNNQEFLHDRGGYIWIGSLKKFFEECDNPEGFPKIMFLWVHILDNEYCIHKPRFIIKLRNCDCFCSCTMLSAFDSD